MSNERILALSLQPADTIREVSPDAISYYTSTLAGLELPCGFVAKNKDIYDVKYWDVQKRLQGKFGRFAVCTEDGGPAEPDVLLMGSTVGLGGLDRDNFMKSLRHYEFYDRVFGALVRRGMSGDERLNVHAVDYGSTRIELDETGIPLAVSVSGQSIDYGRAPAEGRAETCRLFQELLGSTISIKNADPEPRTHERIIKVL